MIPENKINDLSLIKTDDATRDNSFKKMCNEFDVNQIITDEIDHIKQKFSHVNVIRGKDGKIILWEIVYKEI